MKRLQSLSYKTLFTILFLSLAGIIFFIRIGKPANKVSAAWWDEMWHYRKAIYLTNSGANQTNTQIKLLTNYDLSSLVSSNKLQPDLDDIRFTDVNGNLIKFWIEDATNNSADIWVVVPSLVSQTTILMYYGNSTAQSGETIMGLTSDNPGISCKAIQLSGGFSDRIYYIDPDGLEPTNAYKTYCDMTNDSGGWTLMMKAEGNTATFDYNATYWTTNNTLNPNDADINQNTDAKFESFNSLQINQIRATWPQTGHKMIETVSLITPLTLFQTTVDLGPTMVQFDYTNFPYQTGYQRYGFNLTCSAAKKVRWGWMMNNEADCASNDCSAGIGLMNVYSTTNGGYVTCCSSKANGGYPLRVRIWGRETNVVAPNISFLSTSLQSEESGGGPIAYWKFDEGVGSTAYDSAGNNNGTISGATFISEDQCVSGKCLYFDGTGNMYVTVNDSTSLKTINSQTISMWLKPTAFGARRNPINKSYGGEGTMTLETDGSINYYWGTCGNDCDPYQGFRSNTITLNQWNLVTISRDLINNKLTWYINGKQTNQTTTSYAQATSSNNNVIIGKGYAGNFFGYIDDVKIYPYARTADQIKQDYNSRGSSSSKGSGVNMGTNKNNNSLSDGLVGYWKMDEGVGTTTIDSSGNNNTGTFTGATLPAWSSGKYGTGTSFNGVNSYVDIGNSSTIRNFTNQISVSVWAKYSAYGGGGQPYSVLAVKGTPWTFLMENPSNVIRFRVTVGGQDLNASDSQTHNLNQWYHFVGTYDGQNIKMYKDGILVGTTPATGNLGVNDVSAKIGTYTGNTYNFNGLIDEVRIYNRALSPTEVSALYNYAPGPVGYWDFNDGSGNSVVDKSGNNNNGTWSGTGSHWTQGKIGGGGNFNGINDYVNISESSSINIPYDITVSFWGKLAKPISIKTPLGKYQGVDSGWEFILNTDGTIRFDGRDKSTNYRTTGYSTLDISDNWHYITGQRQGGIWKLYIDGILNKSFNSGTFGDISGTGKSFEVGRSENSNGLATNGKIDDVKIYNYARTQKQIIEDMNAGAPATSAKSMVAYYKFDEGSGTTANNSGLGNSTSNGILYNSPIWTNEGKIGKTLSLNGSNTYIKTSGNLDAPANVTVTAWIKANNTSSTQYLVNQARDSYCSGYGILLSSNNLYFKINANSADDGCEASIGTSYLDTNKWHYIAGSYDGKTTKLYIDGVLKNSSVGANGNIVYKYNEVLNIGKMAYGEPTLYFPFNGLIDEVKIYNYALTDEEIKQDYNAGSAIQFGTTTQNIGGTTTSLEYCIPGDTTYCAPPIAEWKMDEGVGTSVVDTSGNNNTVTLENSPIWTQGKVGKSIQLNGSNQRGNAGNNISPSNITIETWVYRTSTNTNQGIIRKESTYAISLYNNTIQVAPGNNWTFYNTNLDIPLNTWTHITFNYDGSTMKVYKNGQLGWSANLSGSLPNNSNTTYIGYDNNNWWWGGKIDHFKIYNYARTPAQIAYDYNKGGPVGWWKFDECQGNIAHDWSGNQNNGTINIGSGGSQNSLGTCAVGTSAAWTNGSTGKINSSLNFDGIDDYISIPDNPILNTNTEDFTISFWGKSLNYVTSGGIINKGLYWTNGPGYAFTNISNPQRVYFNTYDGTTQKYINTGIGPTYDWTHFIGLKKGATIEVWINGKYLTSNSAPSNSLSNNSSLILGRGTGGYWDGQIDDVRIYNYALTAEQVKQVYNGGAVNFR